MDINEIDIKINDIISDIIPELKYYLFEYLSIFELLNFSKSINNIILNKCLNDKLNSFKKLNIENIEEFFNLPQITQNCDNIFFYINNNNFYINNNNNDYQKIKNILEENNYYFCYHKIIYSLINDNHNIRFTEINESKNKMDLCGWTIGLTERNILRKDNNIVNFYYYIEGKNCYIIKI